MSLTKRSLGSGKTSVEKESDYTFAQRAEEQDRADRIAGKKKKKSSEMERGKIPYTALYDMYMDYLNDPSGDFAVIFDPAQGLYNHHSCYIKVKPPAIKGIENDEDFRILCKLRNHADQEALAAHIWNIPGWVANKKKYFHLTGDSDTSLHLARWEMSDLANPSGTLFNTDESLPLMLKRISKNRLIAYRDNISSLKAIPVRSRHLFIDDDYGKIEDAPISYVPATRTFSNKLADLSFEKIFPIFPEHECALFKLWMGRVGVGPSNHIPVGHATPIKHMFRLGLVVLGEPGVGKSHQMKCIRSALTKVGMTFETFKDPNAKFGVARYAMANVAYKDDNTKKSLSSVVSNDTTKQLISNDEIAVEEKNKDPITVIPRCAFLMNANEMDRNTVYSLDSGIVDRVKILQTRGKLELNRLLPKLWPDPNDRPPSLEPATYFLWLEKRYGVSTDCLMLWALRQATNEFYDLIQTRDPLVLRNIHHHHSNRLRQKFMPNIRNSAMKAMVLSMMLTSKTLSPIIPELSSNTLGQALKAYLKVHGGRVNLSNAMKADWQETDCDLTHFWQGFKDIYLPSVRDANDAFGHETSSGTFTRKKAIEAMNEVIDHLHTRGGQKLTGGFTHLAEDWNMARNQYDNLIHYAKSYRALLSPEALTYLTNGSDPDLDWLNSPEYSPENAEEIRPTMWSAPAPSRDKKTPI